MSTRTNERHVYQDPLVDDFGSVIGHAMGWPPMAGRAVAILMLSEQPMSTHELQTALGASAGSMSQTTRLLITNGVIRRFKGPGTRHFVYEWRKDAWVGCLQHQIQQATELLRLARLASLHGADLPVAQRTRMADMQEYYEFMVTQLSRLLCIYTEQGTSSPVVTGS